MHGIVLKMKLDQIWVTRSVKMMISVKISHISTILNETSFHRVIFILDERPWFGLLKFV